MNRGPLPLVRAVVIAALLIGVASAQTDDAFLERYDIAMDNLQRSVASLPSDAVQARVDLDAAFSVLLTMSRETTAGALAAALERVVERARVAIGNASQDDLAVQVAVLEGGFQRLVYDAALRAAVEGDVTISRGRLLRLAADLGMGQADRDAIGDTSTSVATMRFDFEAGVAEVIATRLAVADELLASSVGGSYRSLARAYGAFLLVQDSPRASTSLNQYFVDAAQALVDERIEDSGASLRLARDAVEQLGSAARTRQGAGAVPAPPTVPSDLPATNDVAPSPLAEVPPTPDTAEAEPVDAETPVPPATPDEAAPQDTVVLDESTLAALRLEIEAELRAERLGPIEDELANLGVSMLVRSERAEALLDAGFDSVGQAFDSVAARLGEALAAAQRGDADAAGSAMRAAASGYDAHVSPLVRLRSTTVDVDTAALLDLLADQSGLRTADVTVAAAQLEAARGVLHGALDESALLTGARHTLTAWHGLPRAIVLTVIGLLALVPLVLSNIAFGGGNRNWQLVGVALFLLLVPVIFEGLVGIAILLADLAGVELLLTLPALSPFTSVVGQVVWLTVMLLAIILVIRGLYGISAQFGLVGRRRAAAQPTAGARSTRSTRSTAATGESIDWDDD